MGIKTLRKSKVLDEIHQIREQITEETRELSPKEEVKYWKNLAGKKANLRINS